MAATDLGKAYVQIVPSARGIESGMKAALNPAAASAGQSAGTSISKNMGQRISAVGKNFIKAGAIATAVSVPIVNGIKDALSAYEVQATAETKLTEIYKSRMGVGKKAAQSTMDLASALQKQGVIGDEVTISGAQQLATFAKYPGTVDKLLPAMDNLLAQQKGVNATTDDAVNIGNLMGKVLMGQTGALKRVGISFTDAQEQVLKYGTEEEKAATLAEVINDNVGNMNSELAKTPSGQMAQLSNTMGDIKEEVGAALAPLLAKLANFVGDKLVPVIEKIVGFMQKHPVIGGVIIALTGLLAVGGPLLIMIGTIMTVLPALSGVFAALAGPVGIVIGAIMAAIAIGIALYKNWDKVKAILSAIWEAIKAAASKVWNAIKGVIIGVWNAIKKAATTIWNGIKTAITKVWTTIKTVASTIWNGTKNVITSVLNGIKAFFTRVLNGYKFLFRTAFTAIKNYIINPIKNAVLSVKKRFGEMKLAIVQKINALRRSVKEIFNKIKNAITAPIEKAKETVKNIIDKIKGFFKFKVHLPHIKLPHFSIQPTGWSIGDLLKGSIPSLGIDWYAKGGIVDRPTVLGAGDVRGGEGIVPLDPFWKQMEAMADSIVGGVATVMAGAAGGGDIHIDNYLYPSGPKMGEVTVSTYDKYKKIMG